MSVLDATGNLHDQQGRFAGHLQAEGDAGELLTTASCSRCHADLEDEPSFAGLCVDCAEDQSECPECGRDTSGLNPAENGCPDCGGGHNDCGMCGATDCATYRDDDRILCDRCFMETDDDDDDDDE